MKNPGKQKRILTSWTKCAGLCLPTWRIIAVTLVSLATFANIFLISKPIAATSNHIPSSTAFALVNSDDLGDCGKNFLTFKPWFNGLCIMDADGKGGNIVDPSELDGGLTAFVWIIILNVIAILLQVVGYISVGFIIWGGFQYILAQGEPAKLTTAQKTIINAIIGLVIAIFANIIINTIVHFITQGDGTQI